MAFLGNSFLIYVKTADGCQLNCSHCMTGGNKPKGFFDADKTIKWFKDFESFSPWVENPAINLFGGEPMLAPLKSMNDFIDQTQDLWKGRIRYTITTNLVYPLTQSKIDFFRRLDGVSTSWDKDIRFQTEKQFELWKKNCIRLIKEEKIPLTLQISLSKSTVALDVKEIFEMAKEIGFDDVQFEKLSLAGNIFENLHIIPTNSDIDTWFMNMYQVYKNNEYYKSFSNSYLNSILSSIVYKTYSGCRSRNCETKVFTINANGKIGNCPNNASYEKYQIGSIDQSILEILSSKNRQKNISCEATIDPRCTVCPVYDICAGGCVRSTTEMWAKHEPQCPEAKSLMIHLKSEQNIQLYKSLMNGFQGSEIPILGT